MPEYSIGAHHRLICDKMEAIERGEIDRLIITAPPRHGKSELVSKRFPAWYLGKHPNSQFISASYGADLASDFGRDVRNIIAEPEYAALFPNVGLAADSKAKGRWHTNAGGSYVAAGVGTAITGRGADILNIDDPFANREEADSPVRRDTVWNWYTSTAYTRLMPGGAVVVTATRWHSDDLIGRLLAAEKDGGDKWDVLHLPAIDHLGDALWPERYGVSALKRIRAAVGERDWSALYQGEPRPQEGSILKSEWWKPWLDPAPTAPDAVLISLDTAYTDKTQNDASACTVWHIFEDKQVYRSKVLLRFAWRERLEFPALVDHVADTVKHFSIKRVPLTVLVEAKASGLSVVQEMRRRLPDVVINSVVPRDDKVARAYAVTSMLQGGIVHVMARKGANGQPEFRPWAQSVIDECAAFPLGAHDDQVDSVTQALRHIRDMGLELFSEDEIELPIRPPGPLF